MKRIKVIAPKHRGTTILNSTYIFDKSSYEFEEIIEKGENEVLITASIKINPKTTNGKKLIYDMIEKQSSPIKKILQKRDNELHMYSEENFKMHEIEAELKDLCEISD